MKPLKPSTLNKVIAGFLPAVAALLTQLAAPWGFAATYYWDNNGTDAGFGTAAGTWADPTTGDTTQGWSTDSTGATLPGNVSTTTSDALNFGTASAGLAPGTVTVSATVSVNKITYGSASGAVTLSGGSITLGGSSPSVTANKAGQIIASALTLSANASVVCGTSGNPVLSLNGGIGGTGNVTFTTANANFSGSATVVNLGGACTYSGNTTITAYNSTAGHNNNVTVKANTADALPTSTVLTLDGGAGVGSGRTVAYDLNGNNQTLAGLVSVTGLSLRYQRILNSSVTAATLTINNASDYSFSGNLGVSGSAKFGLTKSGTGTFTLAAGNSYTGDTTINSGMLKIAGAGTLGSGSYAGNLSIASGAALVFSGTASSTLGGAVSGAGSLTNSGTGTVTLAGTDTLANTVVANGGTVAINGGFVSLLSVNDGGTVSLPGTGTVTNLTCDNTASMTFNVANGGVLTSPVEDGITNNGGAGSITINITGSAPADGTYTLIAYSGSLQGSGFSAYQLGATPVGKAYRLLNTAGAVQLVVTTPLIWTGAQSSEWSTNLVGGLQNWTYFASPADYVDGSPVLFDDTLSGTSSVDISVADVMPSAVAFNNGSAAYTLQGSRVIAGSASLTMSGSNTLTVLNNNTYSGSTLISAGTVQVGNGGASGALGTGAITDNGALQFNRSDSFTVSNVISGTGTLAQNGVGTLTLSGVNSYKGDTTVSAGTLQLGADNALPGGTGKGNVTVNGTLDLNAHSNTINGLSGAGTVDTVAGGTPTLTVGGNNASSSFSGVIQNTAGALALTKTGNGTLTLAGENTYTGDTHITAGILAVTNSPSPLGVGGAVFIDGGIRLLIQSSMTITNPIVISTNAGTTGNGLVHIPSTVSGVTATLQGPITIYSNAAAGGHFYAVNNTLIVSGVITSGVPVTLRNGTGIFSGGGTGYTNFTLNQGTLQLGAENGLATTATLSLAPSGAGTFDLNGYDQSLAGLIATVPANAKITNSSTTTPATLTLTGGTAVYGGKITDGGGAGKVNLTLNGANLTLSNANPYSGSTTITAGTLLVNNVAGSGTGTGAVMVNGGVLGGTGTIAGVVINNAGGTLSPGSSIGTLTLNSDVVLKSGSTNTFEVDGSAPANDSVVVGGSATYRGVLNIVPSGAFTNGQSFTLFSGAGAASASNFATIVGSPGSGLGFSFTNGVLSVVSAGPSGPATLTNSVSGHTLSLSWAAGQGWRLQQQTNSLGRGLSTNWVYVTDGTVSSTNITVDTTQPTLFYRLTYP